MSGSALSFIITHGNLAESLSNVSDLLVSPDVETFTYSNSVKTLEELSNDISEIIDRKNPENLVFFTDMKGGSCWMLVNRLKQKYTHAKLITGVNVPMLISFQINYNKLNWDKLIEKILQDGKEAIISR